MLPILARGLDIVVRLSWQAAVLIFVILLVQWLARRHLPARWRYNLWLLVVIRLLLPVSPQSALSVFNVAKLATITVSPAPSSEFVQMNGKIISPTNPIVPAASGLTWTLGSGSPADLTRRAPTGSSLAPSAGFEPIVPGRRYTWGDLLLRIWLSLYARALVTIWLAGMAVLALRIAWTTIRALLKVRRAMPISDPAITSLFETCRREMRVAASMALRETPFVKSPALFGFFRPRLLLPPGLTGHFALAELRYVFLHELAHVKRRDVAMNWLLTLLQVIHWFNPVIWFGFARLRADRELACDALAMSCAGENEARPYGLTIIKLLETFSRTAASPGLVGIMENKGQMTRRLRLIAGFRQNRKWSWLAMTLLAALAVTGLTDAVRSTFADPSKIGPSKPMRLTVLDAQTGEPIPGAGVIPGYQRGTSYPGGLRWPYRTDKDGLVVVPTANYFSWGFGVVAEGYAPRAVEWLVLNGVPPPPLPAQYTIKLERGITIGGVVRDAAGRPFPDVRVAVKGFTELHGDGAKIAVPGEFPFYEPTVSPGAVTDAQGAWTCPHFPSQIEVLALDCTAADGSFTPFHTALPPGSASAHGELIDLDAAKKQDLVCAFRTGTDVRGVVLGPLGAPLAGIKIVETDRRHPGGPVSVSQTGADGRFVFPNRDPHQIQLTLSGAGLAISAPIVTVAPGMPEVVVTMHLPEPLRVRTVDPEGRRVAGVKIAPSEPLLAWTGTSDAEGRVSWSDAPAEAGAYSVYVPGYASSVVDLAANGAEQTIVLHPAGAPGVLLHIKAGDEAGHPLDVFKVVALWQTPGGFFDDFDQSEVLGEGRAGTADVLVPYASTHGQDFRVRIESPGQRAYFSDRLDGPVGAATFEAHLTAVLQGGGNSRLAFSLPNGQPAAGATVAVSDQSRERSPVEWMFLGPGKPRVERQEAIRADADATGTVQLPSNLPPDSPVFVVHADGYLISTLGELAGSPHAQLRPWGKMEGTMTLNGRPKANQRLELREAPRNHAEQVILARLSLQYFINTDHDGHFVVTRVPAGRFTLSGSQASGGTWPESHPQLVEVADGLTTRVAYDTIGRAVTGRVQIAPADAAIDWKKDVSESVLARQLPEAPDGRGPAPDYTDFMRQTDYRRALAVYFAAHRFAPPRSQETYLLDFDANGAFHADGIPPGTYDLKIDLVRTTREQTPWGREDLGALERTVVVPAAPEGRPDALWNLGALDLAVNAGLLPKRPSVAFSAQTLDGHPVNLGDYRGKNVLVTFWATWAPPTAEQLTDWKKLAETYAANPRFALIGVCLDDDVNAVRQFIQANTLPGLQTRLDGSAKSSVTEALKIDDLPASLLIDPDGRLAARDLAGPRLRAAVDAALASTP